jgi:hypothetical protein
VLLVVTSFPSQIESVLRLLRQQSFVVVSFAFSSCCKCQFFLIARVSLCLRGLVFPNIQSLNTNPRPPRLTCCTPRETRKPDAWRGLLNAGPQRCSWCKLNPSSLAQTSGMVICSLSLWYLTSVVCFCFEITIFNSTAELRVPQFVDLT